jgi:hypothetical protein
LLKISEIYEWWDTVGWLLNFINFQKSGKYTGGEVNVGDIRWGCGGGTVGGYGGGGTVGRYELRYLSSWLLEFFQAFQLAYQIFSVFSWLSGFFRFSVGFLDFSGFSVGFWIVQVFSWPLRLFGVLVGFCDFSGISVGV